MTSATPPNAPQRASAPKPRIVARRVCGPRRSNAEGGGERVPARARGPASARLPRARTEDALGRGKSASQTAAATEAEEEEEEGRRSPADGREASAEAGNPRGAARGPRRGFARHRGRHLRGNHRPCASRSSPSGWSFRSRTRRGARRIFGLRRGGPQRGGKGGGASRGPVPRWFDLPTTRDCSSAANSSSVAGGFRGGGPRGTLRRGFISTVVVVVARGVRARVAGFVVIFVVVSRFGERLRVDEFLEGKILVVLGLGGASESVGSRAIRPVAEGGSRTLLAVRRDVRGGRGEPSRSTSTRALRRSRRGTPRGASRTREGERARHGHGVRRVGCGAPEKSAPPGSDERGLNKLTVDLLDPDRLQYTPTFPVEEARALHHEFSFRACTGCSADADSPRARKSFVIWRVSSNVSSRATRSQISQLNSDSAKTRRVS